MSDDDQWPRPAYYPGEPKHLHALGVISVTFATLDRYLECIYLNKAAKVGIPTDLASIYFFAMNEEKRVEATRALFTAHENEESVRLLISDLLDYYLWCRDCRNHILHSERYPPSFGGDEFLYLTKRLSKQSTASGYMKFSLIHLRSIADKMRAGVVQCAELHIYLRYRDRPADKIPADCRAYADTLPKTLEIPKYLKLRESP